MGQKYTAIPDRQVEFIKQQKIFFVGTAGEDTRVNVSPKGMDSFRVMDANRVLWLNVTGSGNETAAHIHETNRMTIMFCAFDGKPLILRLYGTAKEIKPTDSNWDELYSNFPPKPGVRQIFDMTVDLVQTSCGMSVPNFDYKEDRELLNKWAEKKGPDGIERYWKEKNSVSIDGKEIGIPKTDDQGRPIKDA